MFNEMLATGSGGSGGGSLASLEPLVPFATGDSTSEGTIIYSSQYSSEKAFNAFSAPTTAQTNWSTLDNTFPAWIGFEFNSPKVVRGVMVLPRYLESYKGWKCKMTVDAWDGSNWKTLSSDAPQDFVTSGTDYKDVNPKMITVNNTQAYSKYRISLSDGVSYGTGNQANIAIGQVQFYG